MALGGGGAGGGSRAISAGGAFVRLFTDDIALRRGLESARRRVAAFGVSMAKAGTVAFGAASGAAGLVGWKAIDTLGDTAKLAATADAFGLTAESASRLFGIMGSAGSDIRDATEGIVTLGQRVSDALSGKGEEAADLFTKLGVGAKEFAGLAPDQQFYKLLDSLRAVQDPALRVQLLLKAVGEDTGKNLIPLLGQSAEEVQELGERFETSAAEMAAARGATAAYAKATALLEQAWRQVAVSLAPAVVLVSDLVSRAATAAAQFVRENRALVLGAAAGVGVLGAAGAALVGLGTALSLAAVAAKGLAAGLGLVFSPLGLVAAAVGGLGYLYATQTTQGQAFVETLGTQFSQLKADAVAAVGGVTDALSAGDLELAGRVAMAGLNVAWQAGLVVLQSGWNQFKAFFVDGWHDATKLVSLAFVDLFAGLRGQLGDFLRVMSDSFEKLPGWAKHVLDPTGLGRGVLGAAADVAQGDPDAIRDEIERDAARAQAQRDRARADALAGRQSALDAARAELDRLTAEARGKAAKGGPAAADPAARLASQIAGAVKATGAFLGGANSTQVFGRSVNVQQQQLAVQKDIRAGIGNLADAVDALPRELARLQPVFT